MPFSAKSLDYLIENRLNDSKEWYNAHKDDHRRLIAEPFAELITALAPTMHGIDEEIVCNPKKISRMYRDTRFSTDKTMFRENVWCVFGHPKDVFLPPCYYVDISPNGLEYGCGFYQAGTEIMEIMRSMITSNDKLFKAAFKSVKEQEIFEIYGDMYKKNRFPEQPPEYQDWLNRKNLGLSCHSKDFDLLFSDKLADKLAEDFKQIAPFYRFIVKADSVSKEKAAAK